MKDRRYHKITWTPDNVRRMWDFFSADQIFSYAYFACHSGHRVAAELNRMTGLRGNIVDIGCGPGYMLKHLLAYSSWTSYTGVDSSSATLSRLTELGLDAGRPVRVVSVDRMDSEVPAVSADLVLCLEVIEHCDAAAVNAIMRSVRRILRKGCPAVFTTPNLENLAKGMRVCPECGCVYHAWQHVRRWDRDSLAEVIEDCGLKVQNVHTCDLGRDDLGISIVRRGLLRLRYGAPWRGNVTSLPHLVAVATVE